MTTKSRLTLAVVALVAGVSLASAQTAQDHTAHHPSDQDTPHAQSPEVPSGPMARGPAKPGAMKMKPGGPGMMSGRDMMQMMTMMETMRAGMTTASVGPTGMGPLRHVEGQIAFYKAELKITDAQAGEWNAFTDVLRGIAAKRRTMPQAEGPATAPEQIERTVAALSLRLDAMKSVVTAAKPLYAVLSDDQKKIADDLVAEHTMGMQPRGMRMP
jgi:hypothetical protein